ncbi:hypothetical protein A1351_22510 [Methylosinus sp. R-45379]|uniref:hypothetical protein n=1 Tax=Methylosinus sp. R-45379 TaxID=980563 RepID=UPI0007C96776|nr:hypothetical protein [Methylosinus sp. R-45379]OAI30616.1 hypothetical protein A1351_22510 [Methylosinus sp. R-45379]
MSGWRLIHVPEPRLAFGFGQTAEHPKDGLFLYGPPASNLNPARMDVGVVATAAGIERYQRWVKSIGLTISPPAEGKPENKMFWPGFEAVFAAPWPEQPYASCVIDGAELSRRIRIENRYEAISEAAKLYGDTLRRHLDDEEARPKLWFAVLPEEVFRYGRPKSIVPRAEREKSTAPVSRRLAKTVLEKGWLFPEDVEAAEIYEYELNFHNQLKARLLDTRQVIQVVRETTLTPEDFDQNIRRSLQHPSAVAWNLSTTAFYKADGRPWRVADIRDGVCYVGLVFKRLDNASGRDNACCGAQMFLGSGDGVVFKGAVGPWHSATDNSFHLSKAKAAELMDMIIRAYTAQHGKPPNELFIHGKVRFDNEEWAGFSSTVPPATRLVGVQIRRQNEVKLFRYGSRPVLRGTAAIVSERFAYLWTVGFTPRLATYPGREVPNPLTVDVVRGDCPIETVLGDLMALTKLNFNGANFSDGLPVTLRFADLVGEILTAGPNKETAPLPFKFYI